MPDVLTLEPFQERLVRSSSYCVPIKKWQVRALLKGLCQPPSGYIYTDGLSLWREAV